MKQSGNYSENGNLRSHINYFQKPLTIFFKCQKGSENSFRMEGRESMVQNCVHLFFNVFAPITTDSAKIAKSA